MWGFFKSYFYVLIFKLHSWFLPYNYEPNSQFFIMIGLHIKGKVLKAALITI